MVRGLTRPLCCVEVLPPKSILQAVPHERPGGCRGDAGLDCGEMLQESLVGLDACVGGTVEHRLYKRRGEEEVGRFASFGNVGKEREARWRGQRPWSAKDGMREVTNTPTSNR